MLRPAHGLALVAAILAIANAPGFPQPAPSADALPSILICRQLAEARELEVGDTIRLTRDTPASPSVQAQLDTREFRIAGTYEPTPDPARINAAKFEARLHLPDLLALTSADDDVLAAENVEAISIVLQPGVDPAMYA